MAIANPKEGDLNINGIRLHYLDWGGSGDPIVILHATGLLGRIYRPIAEPLTAIGRVFSFDQRGHGDSGRPAAPAYNWHFTMEDLEGFIAAMGLSRVRGFGHSAGATALAALASRRPDLIPRAVLAEPVVFQSAEAPEAAWRDPFVERTLKRKRIFDSVDAMFANFDRKPPYDTWRKEILRDYCEFGTRATADGKRELKCIPEIEAQYYESSRHFDGLGYLLHAQARLLVIFGERGDSLGLGLADKIAAELPNGRVITMPGVGHFLPMEQPEKVARLAIEFFSADSA